MSDHQNDPQENTMNDYDHTPPIQSDPASLAMERVTEAVELVERGPQMIRETYDAYMAAVRTYRKSYDVLNALDAVTGVPAPDTLPGVKALTKSAQQRARSRRSTAKKAA